MHRININLALNSIGTNLAWNGRTSIHDGLMALAVDIAANGQEKPGEVVNIGLVREFAKTTPWVAKLLEGVSSEVSHFLLSGHRRYSALELALERHLLRDAEFLAEDITDRITKPSDLRRINIRENAQQVAKTPAEICGDVLRMRDVEGIPIAEIAEFYGRGDEKGVRWVKEAAKLAKDLHPSVYRALELGTLAWSTACEYAKMPSDDQARAIQKGLTKVAEVKADRSETAGRAARVPGGSVGYKSTKDQLAGLDALLEANKAVKTTSAEYRMIAAICERLRGGTSIKQFVDKLAAIHANDNLDVGLLKLKADAEADEAAS